MQIRFNKTREIFLSVARVLNIFLTTAANSASVERLNSKEGVPKVSIRFRLPSMRRGEPAAAVTQLMSKCL